MYEEITNWLVSNRYFLRTILKDLITQRDKLLASEDRLFHNDIEREFQANCKNLINVELGKALGSSIEDIKLVTDSLNVTEYLNV